MMLHLPDILEHSSNNTSTHVLTVRKISCKIRYFHPKVEDGDKY